MLTLYSGVGCTLVLLKLYSGIPRLETIIAEKVHVRWRAYKKSKSRVT